MKNLIRSKNFYIMVLCDAVLVITAYYLAFLLRSDGKIPEAYLALFKETVLLVVATKIFFFFVFNLYRGMWRFTGINDLKNVVAATLLSSMAMYLVDIRNEENLRRAFAEFKPEVVFHAAAYKFGADSPLNEILFAISVTM